MPQDPSILLQPAGDPFLTVPDGTTAPLHDGTPVDLTGVPLTVEPALLGSEAAVVVDFPGAGDITIGNLAGLTSANVGGKITLSGCFDEKNNGTYEILSVASDTILVSEAHPLAGTGPDSNNYSIAWFVTPAPNQFNPGDPLSYIARQNTPLNIMSPTSGPATFGAYDPILGTVDGQDSVNPAPQNAGGGNQSSTVEKTGFGTPTTNDEQNPTRLELSALIPNNPEGLAQTMQSAPKPTNLGKFIAVKA